MATMINLLDLINKANGKDTKETKKQAKAEPETKALVLVSQGEEKPQTNDEKTLEEVAAEIMNLDGIKIELCGKWLWVSGDTKKNREALKAAGLRWACKKKMWYYRQQAYAVHGRHNKSMGYIRAKYGSEELKEA